MKTYKHLDDFVTDHNDLLNNIDDYIQDAYWSGDFNTDVCLELCEEKARELGINIDPLLDVYDSYFYEFYQCTEKGLS